MSISKKVWKDTPIHTNESLIDYCSFSVIPSANMMATPSAMWTVVKSTTGLKKPRLFPVGRKCAPVTFYFIIQEDRLGKRGRCN